MIILTCNKLLSPPASVVPQPGFVVRVFLEPGHRKVFVNVCQSEIVAEATCGVSKTGSKKKRGAEWNIPYSLTPGRGDLDKCECIPTCIPLIRTS